MDTWTDLLGDFETAQRARGLAERTVKNRTSHLTHLARVVGVSPERVSLRMLRGFLGRAGVSDGTRSTERDSLRAFFAWCVEDGVRTDDPSAALKPIRRRRGLPRPYTAEQLEALLSSGAYSRTRAMILLGYYAGMRRSEIAKVRGEDFVLDVERPYVRVLGKGGVERNVTLHGLLLDLVPDFPRHGYWFPGRGSREGSHVAPGTVSDLLADAKRRAGITDAKLTPHSTRHAFATDLLDSGATLEQIQQLMGHASTETTMIYTRVSTRGTAAAVARLPALNVPGKAGRRRAA